MQTINLALDSKPLGNNIWNSFDHSGLQLFGLEHTPLHQMVEGISTKPELCTIKLKKAYWKSGEEVLAFDYIKGLEQLFKHSPFIKILFRNIHTIKATSKRKLEITFDKNFKRVEDYIKLPNWVAYKEKDFFGKYQIFERNNKMWKAKASDYNQLNIKLINNPWENFDFARNKKLVSLADTAIPLEKMRNNDLKKDIGLIGLLSINQNKNDYFKYIASDLKDIEFPMTLNHAFYNALEGLEIQKLEVKERGHLKIAFDEFYPNELILSSIKLHLENKGWKITLIKDNYYMPSNQWDLKFQILRPLANNNLFKAYQLLSFPNSSFNESKINKKIKEIEEGAKYQLQDLIGLELAIPLYNIPLYEENIGVENNIFNKIYGDTNELAQ